MAYFPDLSNKCQIASGDDVRAIGWLDKIHSFTTGSVNPDFLQSLKQHIAQRWTIVLAAGVHECELCSKFASGGNVIIPTETFVYIAPEMISHYIEAHNYKPPDEFIKTVIDCPKQESPEYMKLIQKYIHHWEL
jgi:hypothetical protein